MSKADLDVAILNALIFYPTMPYRAIARGLYCTVTQVARVDLRFRIKEASA